MNGQVASLVTPLVIGAALLAAGASAPAGDGERRIVSLAPHLTELAFDAGIGDRLVGVVEWSDFPEAAESLPRIGDAFRFDLERIVRLEATHALAWARGTPAQAIDELEQLGIEVEVISITTLDGIAEAIERLGRLGGDPETANERAAGFRKRLEQFSSRIDPPGGEVSIFYQVSRQPLFTLGGQHVINEVFALCNARNAFAEVDSAALNVDLESVLARDPPAIVAGHADGTNRPGAHWNEFPDLHAVRCDNVLEVDPALLVRPTPRVIEGARRLCRWLEREVRPAEDPACRIDRD